MRKKEKRKSLLLKYLASLPEHWCQCWWPVFKVPMSLQGSQYFSSCQIYWLHCCWFDDIVLGSEILMGILWNSPFRSLACYCSSLLLGLWHQSTGTGKKVNHRGRLCLAKLKGLVLLLTPQGLELLLLIDWHIFQDISWLLMQPYYGGPEPLALKTCPDMSGSEKANSTDSSYKHRIMLCCLEFSNDSCLPLTWPYKTPSYPALVNLSRLSHRQTLLSLSSLATLNYFKHLHILNLPGFSCLHALHVVPRWG